MAPDKRGKDKESMAIRPGSDASGSPSSSERQVPDNYLVVWANICAIILEKGGHRGLWRNPRLSIAKAREQRQKFEEVTPDRIQSLVDLVDAAVERLFKQAAVESEEVPHYHVQKGASYAHNV